MQFVCGTMSHAKLSLHSSVLYYQWHSGHGLETSITLFSGHQVARQPVRSQLRELQDQGNLSTRHCYIISKTSFEMPDHPALLKECSITMSQVLPVHYLPLNKILA